MMKEGEEMARQAWKYSHQLDERDLAFLQHDYITISMGMEYYGYSERPLTRMAKDAGAFYKIGKMTRINRITFDAYLRNRTMRSFNVRDYELFTYMIKCYHLCRMIFEERRNIVCLNL